MDRRTRNPTRQTTPNLSFVITVFCQILGGRCRAGRRQDVTAKTQASWAESSPWRVHTPASTAPPKCGPSTGRIRPRKRGTLRFPPVSVTTGPTDVTRTASASLQRFLTTQLHLQPYHTPSDINLELAQRISSSLHRILARALLRRVRLAASRASSFTGDRRLVALGTTLMPTVGLGFGPTPTRTARREHGTVRWTLFQLMLTSDGMSRGTDINRLPLEERHDYMSFGNFLQGPRQRETAAGVDAGVGGGVAPHREVHSRRREKT